MYLEWTWFALLTLVSVLTSTMAGRAAADWDGEMLEAVCLALSLGTSVGAVVMAWPATGAVMERWLGAQLPQAGTSIHAFTASAISYVCASVWALACVALPRLLAKHVVDVRRQIALAV